MPDQSGKIVLVTGANSGLGYETARALYEYGAHVILACRSQKNAETAISKMKEHAGRGKLSTGILDLSSLQSVSAFAKEVLQNHQQLDILVNNAGIALPPSGRTAEGFELQFGTNFLGHYALTGYLYPLLKNTGNARVVSLSSKAYLYGTIDFDNFKLEKPYDPMREYSQSKLATTIFGVELQRRISGAHDNPISVIAQPGANDSGLSRYMTKEEIAESVKQMGTLMEPWQGALSILYAATSLNVIAGGFYQPEQDDGFRGFPVQAGIEPIALDEKINQQLWNLAEQATQIQLP